MPVFSYYCDCGEIFDKEYPMGKAKETARCPCGKRGHKAVTPPCVHFHGHGWTKAAQEVE